MTPKEVLAMAKENDVKVVDIRYMDFIGTWQHFSVPVHELTEASVITSYSIHYTKLYDTFTADLFLDSPPTRIPPG